MITGTLRSRLATILALPLLVLFGVGGGFSYWVARYYADRVYDRWLYDSAASLARQVHLHSGHPELDLPRAAQEILEWDEEDRTVFSVVGSRSGHIAGQHDLPLEGTHNDMFGQASLYDAPLGGVRMRWASLMLQSGQNGETVTVVVGETMNKRTGLAEEILVAVWLPQVALVIIVAWMTFRLISMQTERVRRLSVAVRDFGERRKPPAIGEDMPGELHPLLEALDTMIGKLDRAAVAQRSFIANAAHQLRTPLTALSLQAEQAAHCENVDDLRTAVKGLQAAAQRAARLANQLLLLSRAEPDAQSGRYRSRTDLHALAFDAASAWIDSAIARGIDLGFDEASQHVDADVDAPLLREALNNLIDNALKYCPAGARVTVSVRGDSDPALVVEDNGPGIAPEERPKVVRRFYRGDSSSDGGSGLGLAIVNEVALAHGGRFVIEDGEDGGLRCVIHVPPAPAAARAGTRYDAPAGSPRGLKAWNNSPTATSAQTITGPGGQSSAVDNARPTA